MSEQPSGTQPPPRGAVRLIFEYEGRRLRLVSRTPVDMLAAPTDSLTGHETHHGFWVEVRDGDGRALHRRVLADPTEAAEVFSNEPGQNLKRVSEPPERGTFTVLVPRFEAADHLAVLASPRDAGPALRARSATELGRFSLTDNDLAGDA
jgi:hypothetical protein